MIILKNILQTIGNLITHSIGNVLNLLTRRMKKMDLYLVKSFIPPFFVAFGIALFVLVMQFLWVYIDEIMGKGLTIFELTELVFYLSMTMVPNALPLGVLISSVMVLGNLAERYELAGLKSAGISLMRIMRPLAITAFIIACGSLFVADKVIPWANLQFHSRFYDIRKAKPTLAFEENVFNDEFQDYTMRIGKKSADGRYLQDVMIYGNQSSGNADLVNQIMAKKGEMFTTKDRQYIVMNLKDGVQYQETTNNRDGIRHYPFVRIQFKSWQKIFDLTQFERQNTDQRLFEGHQKMLTTSQLRRAIDSIESVGIGGRCTELKVNTLDYYRAFRRRPVDIPAPSAGNVGMLAPSASPAAMMTPIDTTNRTTIAPNSKPQSAIQKIQARQTKVMDSLSQIRLKDTPFGKNGATAVAHTPIAKPSKWYVTHFDSIDYVSSEQKGMVRNRADSYVRGIQSNIESAMQSLGITSKSLSKFIYELHLKYSIAAICFIFLFIGAPMGAIVQKGGFGYPILVAIFFFMLYMITMIYCKNLNDVQAVPAIWAAWIPCLVMLPMGGILTWRAMNDYKILQIDFSKWIPKRFRFS
jgi:lipopolysaccharide export system permease protein